MCAMRGYGCAADVTEHSNHYRLHEQKESSGSYAGCGEASLPYERELNKLQRQKDSNR